MVDTAFDSPVLLIPAPDGGFDFVVEQPAENLAQATVTLSNTGFPCLDGLTLPGNVIEDVVEAELLLDEAEGRSAADLCAPPARVHFIMGEYVGDVFPGLLDYGVLGGDGCDGPPEYVGRLGYHLSTPPEGWGSN